jgi:chemotaxis signal transduction protein
MMRDLFDQIRDLESELSDLWRQLVDSSVNLSTGRTLSALEVTVRDQRCLVPVDAVCEVLQMVWPQPIPDAPEWLLGSFEYAGNVVPMVDLGKRFGGDRTPLSLESALILVDRPTLLGLVADEVGAVIEVDTRKLSRVPLTVPLAPFVVASLTQGNGEAAHLLSVVDLVREVEEGVKG